MRNKLMEDLANLSGKTYDQLADEMTALHILLSRCTLADGNFVVTEEDGYDIIAWYDDYAGEPVDVRLNQNPT
jgi:hypothetical protein